MSEAFGNRLSTGKGKTIIHHIFVVQVKPLYNKGCGNGSFSFNITCYPFCQVGILVVRKLYKSHNVSLNLCLLFRYDSISRMEVLK